MLASMVLLCLLLPDCHAPHAHNGIMVRSRPLIIKWKASDHICLICKGGQDGAVLSAAVSSSNVIQQSDRHGKIACLGDGLCIAKYITMQHAARTNAIHNTQADYS